MQALRIILMMLVGAGMLATLGILVAGMTGMARRNHSPERSNALMRWRIIMQAATILAFGLLLLVGRG